MRLADPWLLLTLLILPLLWWWYRRKSVSLRFASLNVMRLVAKSKWRGLRHASFALRVLAVALIIIAVARPETGNSRTERQTEGLDIMLVVDTSRSMEAQDFEWKGQRPTRLAVIKAVIADFVRERPSDRIGMVVFGTEAFTQAPLTLDHEVLLRFLNSVQIGMAGDATAIGDGIGTAVHRLKDVPAKSKIAILLTDGSNTAGRLDPLAAAQAAKALGVKIYTIGVGSDGEVPMMVNGQMTVQRADIDEDLLKKVSALTGGQYFRAQDSESLVKIYATIDKLEKTKIKVQTFANYDDRYMPFVLAAILALLAEMAVGMTRFRRVP